MDAILTAFADAFQPEDNRPIWEWARENVVLPASGFAIPGNFHVEKSRHAIKPFQDFQDETVRKQTICKATQTFGTGVADICAAWSVRQRPGPMMFNFQTDPIAKAHATTRLFPIIRRCPSLKPLLPDDRHDDTKQQITFRNGNPLYVQGPSIANLQSRSIRHSFNDEIWIWGDERLKEAHARVDAFKRIGTSKIMNISQAGLIKDAMDREWQEGDQAEWTVACVHCGVFHAPFWERKRADGSKWGMKWDGGNIPIMESIRFECPECRKHSPSSAVLLAQWNLTGRFEVGNPSALPENKSYHWNALIMKPWPDLVNDFVKALSAKRNGAIKPLMDFIQKDLSEPWNEDQIFERVKIITTDYKPDDAWKEEAFRFMTMDVQKDHFWIIVRAWSAAGSSRLLKFDHSVSWEQLRDIQKEFKVLDNHCFVDIGYAGRQAEVCGRCAMFGWAAFRGEDDAKQRGFKHEEDETFRYYSPMTRLNPSLGLKNEELAEFIQKLSPEKYQAYQNGDLFCPQFRWSNPLIKDVLAALRSGNGADWRVYEGVGRDVQERLRLKENPYFGQMAGEEKRPRHDRMGNEIWEWCKIGSAGNHAFDCECENIVAACMAEIIAPKIKSDKPSE